LIVLARCPIWSHVGSGHSFSPRNIEFNAFLFAPVGDDKNGMVLTVVSALARLGLDPWNEAGRLAGLPRIAATQALARMIGKLPVGDWQSSDLSDIAGRLTVLLPTAVTVASFPGEPSRPGRAVASRAAAWALILLLLVGATFVLARHAAPDISPPVAGASTPSPPSP
jgi:hypothetical protein